MDAKNIKKISINEFDKIEADDSMTYELIDGDVMMSPRPRVEHQRVMRKFIVLLSNLVNGEPCEILPEAELLINENVLVPDLMLICNKSNEELNKQRIDFTPEMVIEIESPSTAYKDTVIKNHLYNSAGIKEYWMVSPSRQTVTIINYPKNKTTTYVLGDMIESEFLPDEGILANQFFE